MQFNHVLVSELTVKTAVVETVLCPLYPQSRQSAKLFLKSSELGLPQPLTRRQMCPPPLHAPGSGGRGTLAGKRGVGRVPIPTRGHKLWYSLYICNLWSSPFYSFDARLPPPVSKRVLSSERYKGASLPACSPTVQPTQQRMNS